MARSDHSGDVSRAELFAAWASGLSVDDVPPEVRDVAGSMVLDVAGLMVAAASEDYVAAVIASLDGEGKCTL